MLCPIFISRIVIYRFFRTDFDTNIEVLVSVDEYKFRLESVAKSIYKADSEYLKNIIQDLYYNYLNVFSDEEYNEALSLIAYNSRFNPP